MLVNLVNLFKFINDCFQWENPLLSFCAFIVRTDGIPRPQSHHCTCLCRFHLLLSGISNCTCYPFHFCYYLHEMLWSSIVEDDWGNLLPHWAMRFVLRIDQSNDSLSMLSLDDFRSDTAGESRRGHLGRRWKYKSRRSSPMQRKEMLLMRSRNRRNRWLASFMVFKIQC